MRTLTTRDIINSLKNGQRVTVKQPILRTAEGNLTLVGNCYRGSRAVQFSSTLSRQDYEALLLEAHTYKTRKEGM